MKFKVTIEEVISQEFEVEANNTVDLYDTVKTLYKDGKLVLDNPNLVQTNVQLDKDSEFVTIY